MQTLRERLTIPNRTISDCLAVDLVGIHAGYGRSAVLRDLSLQVSHGEMIGIAGPNGAGKTTLLRVMMGLLIPQAGSLRLLGSPIDSGKKRRWLRRQIGYVPQEHAGGALPITVLDSVLLGRWGRTYAGWRRPGRHDHRAALQWIERVGLGAKVQSDLRELSGGQRQRVALARALVGEPRLLILDEPTTHLDARVRDDFVALISDLHRVEDLTTVLVSHEDRILHSRTDRVLQLRDGCLHEAIQKQSGGHSDV